ncbi:hypothetical protein LB572_01165 [Mesorhizobium sp. BH1-1-5]|uniref:hypothetical protein n=1 Tax=Mesorhizobium sp. BH1-1-5 TaxID=2876661 RepID=UPI001CCCE957|nr:hypothetical protein [Mesorhizobium sp. BH1-1-5]MBZ9985699.1 hypothetical protein [Mesorhizobium sp. BH1-1-5]
MTLIASTDFNDRLVPRSAPASQEPDRVAAAGVSVRTSAAFDHFTETCGDAPSSQQATAPEHAGSDAVTISEASRFILSLIAAHEGRSERDVLARIIAEAGDAIGIPALLSRGAEDIGDIADLPGYARKAANRFRSGGP